ncbi:hypothetical protein [Piscirickettsia salmonis]|nr:hypothetical protein [Piscirickettsia salmonis]
MMLKTRADVVATLEHAKNIMLPSFQTEQSLRAMECKARGE